MRAVAWVLWAASFVAGGANESGGRNMSTTNTESGRKVVPGISYSHGAGWSGSREAFFALDGTVSKVWISYAGKFDPRSPKPELGRYQRVLPIPVVKRLQQVLHTSRYQTLPAPKVIPPDTKSVAFMEPGANRWTSFPLPQRPPEILPVVEAMEAAINQVREAPLATAEFRARWVSGSIQAGTAFQLELEIANNGSEEAILATPFGERDPRAGGFMTLALKLDDGNEDPDGDEKGFSVRLDAGDLVASAGHAPTALLQLSGGAHRTYRIQKRLRLVPGRYLATLQYRGGPRDIRDNAVIDGEIYLDLPPLLVTVKK
jgi:hypothetical protein